MRKLKKKASTRFAAVGKKTAEVCQNLHRHKPLRNDLHGYYRVHIDSSFVLLFEILEDEKVVHFIAFKHHDDAYA